MLLYRVVRFAKFRKKNPSNPSALVNISSTPYKDERGSLRVQRYPIIVRAVAIEV